jgi:hypothetical protein
MSASGLANAGLANAAFFWRSRLESNRFLWNKGVQGQSNPLPSRGDDSGSAF